MFTEAYTWALRRVFKFIVKRALGRALENELDVEQLDVALSTGTFELRDAILDCEYLRQHLGASAPALPSSGRVGWIRATVPWNALGVEPCVVEIGDVDVVLVPNPDRARASASNREARPARRRDGDVTPERPLEPNPESTTLVARALEKIARGIRVRAVDVAARLDAADDETETDETDRPNGNRDASRPSATIRAKVIDVRDVIEDDGTDHHRDHPNHPGPPPGKTFRRRAEKVSREMTAALRGVVVETADGSSDDERTVMIDEFDVDAAVRREWSSAAAFASDAPPKTRAVRAGTSPARARVDPAIVARLATLAEAFGASPVARDDERATRDDDDDDDDDDRWASPAASFMDDLCGCEQSEPTESSFREVRDRALEEATRATAAFDDGEKRKRVDEDEPVDEDEDEDEDERASTVTVSVPRLAVEAAYGDGDADGDAERLVVEVRGAPATATRATSSGDSVRVAVAYASATEHVRDGDATVRIPAFRVTPPSVDADDEPSRDPDERLADDDATASRSAIFLVAHKPGPAATVSAFASVGPASVCVDVHAPERFRALVAAASPEKVNPARASVGWAEDGARIALRFSTARCALSAGAARLIVDVASSRRASAGTDAPSATILVPAADDDANPTSVELALRSVDARFELERDEDSPSSDRRAVRLEDSGDDAPVSVVVRLRRDAGSDDGAISLHHAAKDERENAAPLESRAYEAVREKHETRETRASADSSADSIVDAEKTSRLVREEASASAGIDAEVIAPRVFLRASRRATARRRLWRARSRRSPTGTRSRCARRRRTRVPAVAIGIRTDDLVVAVERGETTRRGSRRIADDAAFASAASFLEGEFFRPFFRREEDDEEDDEENDEEDDEENDEEDDEEDDEENDAATIRFLGVDTFAALSMSGVQRADHAWIRATEATLASGTGGDARAALVIRPHEALSRDAGADVAWSRVPGRARVSPSPSPARRRPSPPRRRAALNSSRRPTRSRVLADARAAFARAFENDDDASPRVESEFEPTRVSLEAREVCATLEGWSGAEDDERPTVRRGVVRVDAARVVFDAESTETRIVAFVDDVALHVAEPRLAEETETSGAFVPVVAREEWPFAPATLERAKFAQTATVSSARAETVSTTSKSREDVPGVANTSVRVREIRCDARRDAFRAATALVEAVVAGMRDEKDERGERGEDDAAVGAEARRAANAVATAAASASPLVARSEARDANAAGGEGTPTRAADFDVSADLDVSVSSSSHRRRFLSTAAPRAGKLGDGVVVEEYCAVSDEARGSRVEPGREREPRAPDAASRSRPPAGASPASRRIVRRNGLSASAEPFAVAAPPLGVLGGDAATATRPSPPSPSLAVRRGDAFRRGRPRRRRRSGRRRRVDPSPRRRRALSTRARGFESDRRRVPGAPKQTRETDARADDATACGARWFDGAAPDVRDARGGGGGGGSGTDPTGRFVFPLGPGTRTVDSSERDPPLSVRSANDLTSVVAFALDRADVTLRAGTEWRRDAEGAADGSANDPTRVSGCEGITVGARGVSARHETFDGSNPFAWRIVSSIDDAAALDRTRGCRWRRVLAHDDDAPRETKSSAGRLLRVELTAARPESVVGSTSSSAARPETVVGSTSSSAARPESVVGSTPDAANSNANVDPRAVPGATSYPDPDETELRLRAAALPLHLRLDQNVVRFLSAYFCAPAEEEPFTRVDHPTRDDEREDSSGDETNAAASVESAAASRSPYFQIVDVPATSLRVDYLPRSVNLDALRAGRMTEALNLVPLGGVSLRLARVSARGVAGWSAVGDQILRGWIDHVAATQARAFVAALAPVRAARNVGAGAAALANATVTSRGRSSRDVARGVAGLVAAVTAEAPPRARTSPPAPSAVARAVETRAGTPGNRPARREFEPQTAREGVAQAAAVMADGMDAAVAAARDAARRAAEKVGRRREYGGRGGGHGGGGHGGGGHNGGHGGSRFAAVGGVARAGAGAAVPAVAAAATAAHRVLLGAKNQMERARRGRVARAARDDWGGGGGGGEEGE